MHHLPMLTTWLTYQPSSNFALFQDAPPPPHVYPSRPQTTGVIGARIPQALVGAGLTYISCYQRGQALPCPDLVLSYASAPPPSEILLCMVPPFICTVYPSNAPPPPPRPTELVSSIGA